MYNILNKELLYRFLSVVIFVPLAILPLIYSNYAALIIYILFVSIILCELDAIKSEISKKIFISIYKSVSILSFFLFLLLLITKEISEYFLISVIIIIWLFDTFSFLGGKIIGGKKLMPKISPGKTISGFFSGLFMTLIIAGILLTYFDISFGVSIMSIIFIILSSFAGDTAASLLKRYASVKDYGNIMPGHGGLFDRFDSFIFVFFVIGIIIVFE